MISDTDGRAEVIVNRLIETEEQGIIEKNDITETVFLPAFTMQKFSIHSHWLGIKFLRQITLISNSSLKSLEQWHMPVSAMGKSARKNNLSSIQTSLICILRNFKETSTYRNQTYVKCFFNIRNVYKSLYFCFFHGFFVIWVFLCNRMVFQK